MAQKITNVMVMGAGGLFGSEVFTALTNESSLNISILSRKSSKSTFPSKYRVVQIDDDYPLDQLFKAFRDQHALVSTLPGRPYTVHLRMIDAAIQAGVKRFIPTEYGNNTCAAAAELVSLYGDKAKVIDYLKSKEDAGLTWTAIHTGQFFDWGLDAGWLDYHLAEKRAVIYDSGDRPWSATNIGTAAASVVKVLLNPEETKNKPIFVASFTVTQNQVLRELEKATGAKWQVDRITSEEAINKAKDMDKKDYSDGLKLLILTLMYADEPDRGGNFEKDGRLCNKLLGIPEENLADTIERILKR